MELNAETVKRALEWLDSLVGNSYDSDIAMFTYQLLGILYDTCEELTEENKKSNSVFSDLYKEAETYLAQRECLRNQVKNLTEEKYDIECSYKLLKKDNERLHETCTEFERKCASLNDENERLRAENETLKIATNALNSVICDCHDKLAEMLRQKEADTVRKMQERLKAEMSFGRYIQTDQIDQIAKEMVEGANDT